MSTDPKRAFVGDSAHVWTDSNVFNIEGGCYAKVDGLARDKEPGIYDAVKFGAIVQNAKYYPDSLRPRTINYHDTSITTNTRAIYPIEYIKTAKIPAVANHPKNIIFLTCDALGVLPPVSKLTPEQTIYHFLSGYSSRMTGLEAGGFDPAPHFASCYSEDFLPLHPW